MAEAEAVAVARGMGGACSLKRVDFTGSVTRRPRLETITQDELYHCTPHCSHTTSHTMLRQIEQHRQLNAIKRNATQCNAMQRNAMHSNKIRDAWDSGDAMQATYLHTGSLACVREVLLPQHREERRRFRSARTYSSYSSLGPSRFCAAVHVSGDYTTASGFQFLG